jgi:hypothetical protein
MCFGEGNQYMGVCRYKKCIDRDGTTVRDHESPRFRMSRLQCNAYMLPGNHAFVPWRTYSLYVLYFLAGISGQYTKCTDYRLQMDLTIGANNA